MVDYTSLKEENAHQNVELALNLCSKVGINRLVCIKLLRWCSGRFKKGGSFVKFLGVY